MTRLSNRLFLSVCLATLAFTPGLALAQGGPAPVLVAAPGDHVRIWVQGGVLAATGRLLSDSASLVVVDDHALHCGSGGCGPFTIARSAVRRLEVRRPTSGLRQGLAVLFGALALSTPFIETRLCERTGRPASAGCDAAVFGGGALATGGALLVLRTHWRRARLP